MAVKTQGTELYVRMQNTTTGYDLFKVGCPTGITGLGGSRSQIETTCLDDVEQTFVAGFPQPGQVTVNLDFDPSKVSHRELWDHFDDGDVLKWVIGLSDGTAQPTVDGSGTITFATTRSFIEFDGYIADFPIDLALNSVAKTTMQVQRSGARVDHWKH